MKLRLSYGASESCYALRSVLRRNKGKEDDQLAVVVADMKRRSPTSAELPPDVNAFDDAATWASQVCKLHLPRVCQPDGARRVFICVEQRRVGVGGGSCWLLGT